MAAPAQRLKRVFVGAAIRIEIEKCEKCGGKVKVIACIEDPEVIVEKILILFNYRIIYGVGGKCRSKFNYLSRKS